MSTPTTPSEPMTYDEALEHVEKAGLEVSAPPPGWRLVIRPKGMAGTEVLEALKEGKDRLVWQTILQDYEPDTRTTWWLENIGTDMLERLRRFRAEVNKELFLGEPERARELAQAYRRTCIAAKTGSALYESGLDFPTLNEDSIGDVDEGSSR